MSSQGMTRKRPAPGTSPVVPQVGAMPSNPGNQLSNDQFLQWGQNPPNMMNPSFPDPNAYNPAAFSSSQDMQAPSAPPGQITRRHPQNQLVNRNRGYEQPPAPYVDHGGNTGDSGAWEENLDELYKRALAAKKDAQNRRKQIPPFVQKLRSFLDESRNTELIQWSEDGNSFVVLDEDEFAKTLIPELFKHNNYASFVRQLNMYGFHKKVGLSDNSMRASERKNKSPSEYTNPYFKRGHPDLLWLIQKPKNSGLQGTKPSKGGARVKAEEGDENAGEDYGEESGSRDDRFSRNQLSLVTNDVMPKDQLAGVYRELHAIRQQQQIISTTITKLRREHEQLYGQAANFQEQHTRHENSINAILTFLATVYNRSLQGQDGSSQNLANSFAGVISQDQGNIVDVGDNYSLSTLPGAMNSPGGQRSMKKQPLLLKAPPGSDRHSRAATLSPGNTYDPSQPRKHSRQSSGSQPGHVEEVFDSPQQSNLAPPQSQRYPQRDIMSVIQNSNARNGIGTNFADFPNVLSSLETSGGQVPLTPNQRADMLRLMANETNTNEQNLGSQNNALMTPNPPPMPPNYSGRLANTRSEIDNLAKMQAEQDRSVQNLTNLLQPLSPTGTIPGVGTENGNVPPPPLDLDQIFNNDYFTDIGDLEENKANLEFGGSNNSAPTQPPPSGLPPSQPPQEDNSMKDANDLFNFDILPSGNDFLDGSNQQPQGFFGGLDGADYAPDSKPAGTNNNNTDAGRVIEALTDSEGTSPANTVEENHPYGTNGGVPNGSQGNGSAKRRRKT